MAFAMSVLARLTLAAAEHGGKLSFTGHLRGALVVIFAITLFCGSVYLLLATNLGARLGFLVAGGALTGFLVILAALWSTSQFPLNSLHGTETHWEVKEIRNDPSESFYAPVHDIDAQGTKAAETQAGDIKATIDTAITAEDGKFQRFAKSTDYLILDTKLIGGGKKNLFKHRPLFAVAKLQAVKVVNTPFGQVPPPPEADPAKSPLSVILVRNLGTIRLPQYMTLAGAGLLFALCLIGMHRLERAQQEAAATPVPAS